MKLTSIAAAMQNITSAQTQRIVDAVERLGGEL